MTGEPLMIWSMEWVAKTLRTSPAISSAVVQPDSVEARTKSGTVITITAPHCIVFYREFIYPDISSKCTLFTLIEKIQEGERLVADDTTRSDYEATFPDMGGQTLCPSGSAGNDACLVGAPDMVNHPPHYAANGDGVECIQVTRHMNFNLGNAVKYLWRAGKKDGNAIEDLKKAAWYINNEIDRIA